MRRADLGELGKDLGLKVKDFLVSIQYGSMLKRTIDGE